MTSQSEICEICRQPKASAMTGSFTQWVAACRCDQSDRQGGRFPLCAACGRQIDKGNTGSFTEWVLQTEKCSCKIPVPLDPNLSTSHLQGLNSVPATEQTLEEELSQLDSETFPLDRYEPISKLGVGGTGVVYLCMDKHLKKKVAVKVAYAKMSDERVNFQAEAKVTAKFKHPNIVSIIDFGLTPSGAPFMVLEHVDGLSLDKYIKQNGYVPEGVAIPLFIQIASALEKGHESGIFHRDIKSSNIIISQSSKTGPVVAQVIDFGIAMSRQQTTEFHGQNIIGTPKYMSPDQLLGRPFDARSEIYSFGCVMYESLTGSLPFSGDALTLLDMHKEMMPPRFEEVAPDTVVTLQMERVVLRCLEKDPDLRFATMTDLMIALHRANRDEAIGGSSTFVLIDRTSTHQLDFNADDSELSTGRKAFDGDSDKRQIASEKDNVGNGFQLSMLAAGTIFVLTLMAFTANSAVNRALDPDSEPEIKAVSHPINGLKPQVSTGTTNGANTRTSGADEKLEFAKLMAMDEKDPDKYFNAATNCGNREQWELALQAIDKAITLKPKGEYYQCRANVKLHLGKEAEAIHDCESAISAGIKNVVLYRSYGAALIGQKRYPEAEKVLTEALKLDPKFRNLRILRAAVYELTHQDKKAIADYTIVLNESSDEMPSRQRRAALYEKLGMKDSAQKDRDSLPKAYNQLIDGSLDWSER